MLIWKQHPSLRPHFTLLKLPSNDEQEQRKSCVYRYNRVLRRKSTVQKGKERKKEVESSELQG